jgi:hypothetical protein
MKARRRFNQLLVLGLGLAALAASGAQAGTDTSDVVSRYVANHAAPAYDPTAARPIEHPAPLADGTDVVSRYLVTHPAAVRTNNRGAIRGVGTPGIVTPAPDEGGTSWDVVGLAVGSGLGALAIALAGFALVQRRRSATAALQS